MNSCVKNDLSLFEFHDAVFSFSGFDGNDLTVSAKHLNVHKKTPHNSSDYDMEIDSAEITFRNFRAVTFDPGQAWGKDENGNSCPIGPHIVYFGRDAMEKLLEELQNGCTVYHFEKEEKGGYSMGGAGTEPYFDVQFDFDAVTICWDACKKKAWYELHRYYLSSAVLGTPKGDETVKMKIWCHEEPVYYKGKLEEPPNIIVGCTFADKEYWGHGGDYLWIDAFADLQKQLPEGVFLKCCLTCRYGNLCPVGNEENEVFCTKDVTILQKSDLYFYTEDTEERSKRSRQYCGLCGDYEPQIDGFYTYNDYLDFLK